MCCQRPTGHQTLGYRESPAVPCGGSATYRCWGEAGKGLVTGVTGWGFATIPIAMRLSRLS